MKNENITKLTETEINLIQKAGFLPDMTAEEIADDPEGSLWLDIRNSAPEDRDALVDVIQDGIKMTPGRWLRISGPRPRS